ncbi:MAG: nucleoside hydrolase [Bacteroidales bacterium]|nr:nucleoside hydrolase [Bacteroidales bacterium]
MKAWNLIEYIPHPIGCDRMVGYAWGYYPGAPVPVSDGVDFIIRKAESASPADKLNIVVLGAVTNVAAAILHAPEIANKLRVFILNMKYDVTTGAWNKNSFNARNDINGLDVLLDNKALELIVMPGNVARELTFTREDTRKRLSDCPGKLSDILWERWDHVRAGDTWIMWDLALVQAILNPEYATIIYGPSPPENTGGKIGIYTDIDADKMRKDFWRTYQ